MAYKKHPKKIQEGISKLKAARREKTPTYPDLPDAPPIPSAADDTIAVGIRRPKSRA